MRRIAPLALVLLLPLLVAAGPTCETAVDADRCAAWDARYDGDLGADGAYDLVVNTTGDDVYAIGTSVAGGTHDFVAVTYDAAAGAHLATVRFDGGGTDIARAGVLSPDGRILVLTGESRDGDADYLTVAIDTVNGAVIWDRRYDGPSGQDDLAVDIAIGPQGDRVYVAGYHTNGVTPVNAANYDIAVIAYDLQSGTQLWVRTYAGPGNGWDVANALAVVDDPAPGVRDTIYVTGRSNGASHLNEHADFATVSWTRDGALRWAARYDNGDRDLPYAMATSPDGRHVYVTGESIGTNYDYATVAFDADNGDRVWASRYNGGRDDRPLAIAATSGSVYVTGYRVDGDVAVVRSAVTVAYEAASGVRRWVSERTSAAGEAASAITVTGNRIYIGGVAGGIVVGSSVQGTGLALSYAGMFAAAYDTSGNEVWSSHHGGAGTADTGQAIALAENRVVLTGGGADLVTVAYRR